jgi:hypothetical protein
LYDSRAWCHPRENGDPLIVPACRQGRNSRWSLPRTSIRGRNDKEVNRVSPEYYFVSDRLIISIVFWTRCYKIRSLNKPKNPPVEGSSVR